MRLEVTKRADLAVRALVAIGADGERIKGRALAERLDTTAGFLAQVMHPLVQAGWVRSDPGPTGGYRCDVDIADLTVLEVIEAVEGRTESGRCVVVGRNCDDAEPCALHLAWVGARRRLLESLDETSMASVAGMVAS
ncbi:MAG: Rrf2 family transcriptional regulator [Actinomycetota bacterium]